MYKIISICIITMMLSTAGYSVSAQGKSLAKDLTISWEPIENNYLGKEQTLFAIRIAYKGKKDFPAKGWKIFFNFGKRVTSADSKDLLTISHINGGLFAVSPGKNFKGIGLSSVEQRFISNSWVVNSSDAPQGFYLVWDNEPAKAIPLPGVEKITPKDQQKMKRFAADRELSQQQLYIQNQRGTDQVQIVGKIFPQPYSYAEKPGYFKLDVKVKITADKDFISEATLLDEELGAIIGKKKQSSYAKLEAMGIELKKDPTLAGESYHLSVSPSGIIISASGPKEINYGIQSLKTLIDPLAYQKLNKLRSVLVKCVEVEDHPSFGFRGVMLDVARNFQSKREILKLIDLLSLYKLNTLHLHLNDDEGWRLQIDALPELTQVGANRGHGINEQNFLMPSYGSGPAPGKSSGSGFYSKADFIEILKYAARRHINVIPEIETPGHARAAIVSMQSRYNRFIKNGDSLRAREYLLRDRTDSSRYRSVQQWNDHVMDVSMPSVYHFLETVTDEIVNMYKSAGAPLETIHFGGDELPAGVWTRSPSVNALRASHPELKGPDELWDYFFTRISAMLEKRRLYLSGWEETALRKSAASGKKRWEPNPLFINKGFHVNVWNNMSGNEDLAYKLANSGYKVVLSFVTNFYFDMAYIRRFDEPGFNWGGLINMEQSFKFIPFDYLKNQKTDYINRPLPKSMLANFQPLSATGRENILGIQGLLWTETVTTPERLEYMYLPRMLALAERAWSPQNKWATETDSVIAKAEYEGDWHRFVTSAGREMERLDGYSGGYQYRIPTPAIGINDGMASANIDIPGFQIRYTIDGTEPTMKSQIYLLPLKNFRLLRFRAFNSLGRGGKSSTNNENEYAIN